jgi:chromosome segregation ATPase
MDLGGELGSMSAELESERTMCDELRLELENLRLEQTRLTIGHERESRRLASELDRSRADGARAEATVAAQADRRDGAAAEQHQANAGLRAELEAAVAESVVLAKAKIEVETARAALAAEAAALRAEKADMGDTVRSLRAKLEAAVGQGAAARERLSEYQLAAATSPNGDAAGSAAKLHQLREELASTTKARGVTLSQSPSHTRSWSLRV